MDHAWTDFPSLKKEGPAMALLSSGGSFGGEMRVPGHANLAECQRGSKGGAPLAKGHLGGIPPGIIEQYFLLARRDPATSIVETVLSRKPFFKHLGFSKNVGSGNIAECQRGPKAAPLGYCPYAGALLPEGVQRGS